MHSMNKLAAALAVFLLSLSSCFAQTTIKEYRAKAIEETAGKNVRQMMEAYIDGVGAGMDWANALSGTQFYCLP